MAAESGDGDKILGRPCHVCRAPIDRDHLNYGAEACYSCRAFFRRLHCSQKSSIFSEQQPPPPSRSIMAKVLVCKRSLEGEEGRWQAEDEFCRLTPENRTSCKRCRYQLCLRAGMRSKSVLTEEQRKRRFKQSRDGEQKLPSGSSSKITPTRSAAEHPAAASEKSLRTNLQAVQAQNDSCLEVIDAITFTFAFILSVPLHFSTQSRCTSSPSGQASSWIGSKCGKIEQLGHGGKMTPEHFSHATPCSSSSSSLLQTFSTPGEKPTSTQEGDVIGVRINSLMGILVLLGLSFFWIGTFYTV